MKITKITYSKLVSFPGYHNETHGAEALVEDGDKPDDVRTELVYFVDELIKKRQDVYEAKYYNYDNQEVPF